MRTRVRLLAQGLSLRRWSRGLVQIPSMVQHRRLHRTGTLFCALLIVASTFVVASTTQASYTNVLLNGSFEQGFYHQPGCGMVGYGWGCFTNGGAAVYGYYDDQWDPVVADGEHSQLIEINTKGIITPDHDRYAGLYQTVKVVDWANYTLSLRGMIRTTNKDGDPWRYRVEVGWSSGPHPNWQAVTNWMDVGWDQYYERTSPGAMLNYSTSLTAESNHVTVYVRVWKKWGVPEEEIDINLDALALTGPAHYDANWKPLPDHKQPYLPVEPPVYHEAKPPYPDPCCQPAVPPPAGACVGPELLYNGGFEQGFIPVSVGHVGRSWGYFTNGGAANYGFYDEQWPPVVVAGQHGQLIEINSKGLNPTDPDRYAGIYQRIGYLHPGATYEFSLRGLLRGEGNEDDPYRFEAQWGYNTGANTEWSHVTNWQGMDLGKIYPRTEPGPMGTYTVRFTAPSSEMVLFIRGWKKWAISNVEMDFNLDAISLRACGGTGGPVYPYPKPWPDKPYYPDYAEKPDYPYYPDKPYYPDYPAKPPLACAIVVQPGDALSWIAEEHGVSVYDLMAINDIDDPDFIYVGQRLVLPDCGGLEPDYPPPCCEEPPPCCEGPVARPAPYAPKNYTVQPGDTFSQICQQFGTDPYALAEINGITNWDLIYVGQVLTIPY
jgi:LysM repeat protein